MPTVAEEPRLEATNNCARRETRLKVILTAVFILTIFASAAAFFSKLAWLNAFGPP
jgi:hypothetical protein